MFSIAIFGGHFLSCGFVLSIERMHKWRPTKYSFVFVLIRLTSLVLKERFFCILSVPTRLVSLISTKTKEYFLAPIYAFGLCRCVAYLTTWTCSTVTEPAVGALGFNWGLVTTCHQAPNFWLLALQQLTERGLPGKLPCSAWITTGSVLTH